MSMPEYMKKHPCTNCGDGYSQCAQGAVHGLQCCDKCNHPTIREQTPPYTKSEYLEMWAGKEMPPHVVRALALMPDEKEGEQ